MWFLQFVDIALHARICTEDTKTMKRISPDIFFSEMILHMFFTVNFFFL